MERRRKGFAVPDFTVHRGERASTSTRFLHPVLHRRNLTVITDALALRLLLQGSRARAVEYGAKGGVRQLHCDGEIVLAAGAFNSPQLLLLSGVGPSGGIEPHGIRVAHDLPGVGANLQEHQSIAMIYRARGAITFDSRLRADRLAVELLRWLLLRTRSRCRPAGVGSGLRAHCARPRSAGPADAGESGVDDGATMVPRLALRGGARVLGGERAAASGEPGFGVAALAASRRRRRASCSTCCRLRKTAATFRRIIRFVRRYFATPAARELVREETIPGEAVESDEALDAFVRANVRTAMHPVGTCAMGTGDDAVVDAQLRVRGIDGLRIADASVMPSIIGGNTNAPVIMIAEKAADLIRGRATSSRTPIG